MSSVSALKNVFHWSATSTLSDLMQIHHTGFILQFFLAIIMHLFFPINFRITWNPLLPLKNNLMLLQLSLLLSYQLMVEKMNLDHSSLS